MHREWWTHRRRSPCLLRGHKAGLREVDDAPGTRAVAARLRPDPSPSEIRGQVRKRRTRTAVSRIERILAHGVGQKTRMSQGECGFFHDSRLSFRSVAPRKRCPAQVPNPVCSSRSSCQATALISRWPRALCCVGVTSAGRAQRANSPSQAAAGIARIASDTPWHR